MALMPIVWLVLGLVTLIFGSGARARFEAGGPRA